MDRSRLYSAYIEHDPVSIDFDEPSRTRQEFVAECDVNELMRRFDKTGVWPMPMEGATPVYFDTDMVETDFRACMDIINEAESAFMSLPASVRREFDNDPAKFVDFASNEANVSKMREWGLAPPEKAPDAPVRVEVVSPPSSSPDASGAA